MLSKNVNKVISVLSKNLQKKNLFNLNRLKFNNFGKLYSFGIKNFSENLNKENVIDVEEEVELINTNKQNLGFKAETKKLLEIVTHSLYTDKEIFLRELMSNCSDALEKQRYYEVTGQLPMTGEPLGISISTNEKLKTITIFDSGIGMTREEMIDNLGSIGKSGTQSFAKNVKQAQSEGTSNEALIGQFGVGFYSSFIVGDTVEVISKPQKDSKAYHWISDGNGEFQISDVENVDFKRGTKVIIHLKTECRDFCKSSELEKIIKKHSNFISYSIKLNGEVINQLQAIWYRERKDVSTEEYQKFFEVVSANKLPYKYLLHFASDVPLDIKALLYIPSNSGERHGFQEENTGLALYSKKVLIKQKCTELLPNYFRFVKGVIDCADIPLSLSRESYQDSSLIYKLKILVTKRIIKKLEEEMKTDPENYDKWYDEFNQYLREGVLTDTDNAEALLRLLRFKSNHSLRQKINLEEYSKKMKTGQDKVFYLNINSDKEIEDNVFLENYKNTDLSIIICLSPLDEMIFRQLGQYKSFKFVNIENESDDFLNQFKQDLSSNINKLPETDITPFTLWIKNELEPYVSKVSISKRLKDSPILVTSQVSSQMKLLMTMANMDAANAQMKDFQVEINPSNELILNLNKIRKEDPKLASIAMKQLYDTALFQAGIPLQGGDFAKRSLSILKTLLADRLILNKNSENAPVEEPVERIKEGAFKDFKDDVNSNTDVFEDFKLKNDKI